MGNRRRFAANCEHFLADMDWAAASKAPFWGAAADVAVTDTGPTMLSFAGPSSSSAAAEGQLQDFSVGHVQRARPATAAGRRGRAPGSVVGTVTCSVDGCRSDLSRCREYHRRHKVCEVHSKTPVVVVSGQEQRFCQQCSRFHMLSEFDEGKRSCRKRLDGHNRRRRKPQHDAMNPGSIFPYDHVNQYSVYPRTFSIADRSADSLMHPLEHQRFSISFSEFKAPKHFPFLQDDSSILSTACPTLLPPFSSGEDGSYIATTSSRCNGLFRTLDPECALSLLSSSLHLSQGSIPSSADSMVTRITAASQAATAATTAFASDGAAPAGDHVLVSDTIFEDPSHALPFSWQV